MLKRNKSSQQFFRTIKKIDMWKMPNNRNINLMQVMKNSPVASNQKIKGLYILCSLIEFPDYNEILLNIMRSIV